MKVKVEVLGLDEVNAILDEIAPREARNLLRATVSDLGGQVAEVARSVTPDNPSTGVGDLKSSIKVKRERGAPDRIEATVRVTNIRRNFFWRFLEYGQGPDRVTHAMFGKALVWARANIEQAYLAAFTRKLIARLVRLRKRAGG